MPMTLPGGSRSQGGPARLLHTSASRTVKWEGRSAAQSVQQGPGRSSPGIDIWGAAPSFLSPEQLFSVGDREGGETDAIHTPGPLREHATTPNRLGRGNAPGVRGTRSFTSHSGRGSWDIFPAKVALRPKSESLSRVGERVGRRQQVQMSRGRRRLCGKPAWWQAAEAEPWWGICKRNR